MHPDHQETISEVTSPEVTSEPRLRAVTLAVLTYQRNEAIRRAVRSMIECAVPGPEASWSLLEVLVVDNNPDGSAAPAVAAIDAEFDVAVRHTHEPTPGIVAARNRALTEAAGDVLVFMDDDEVALPGWPDGLLAVMDRTGAAMVGGPVQTEFVSEPPAWVIEGEFFQKENHADGSTVTWASTSNVAIDLDKIRTIDLWFDDRYPHGEDAMFSRLVATHGLGLRWSSTAVVKEFVEADRTTVKWCRNRQRISTDAWVRSDLDIDPSIKTRCLIAAKAAARLVQGLATLAVGTVGRDEATKVKGLALVAHVQGTVDGLVAFHRSQR